MTKTEFVFVAAGVILWVPPIVHLAWLFSTEWTGDKDDGSDDDS